MADVLSNDCCNSKYSIVMENNEQDRSCLNPRDLSYSIWSHFETLRSFQTPPINVGISHKKAIIFNRYKPTIWHSFSSYNLACTINMWWYINKCIWKRDIECTVRCRLVCNTILSWGYSDSVERHAKIALPWNGQYLKAWCFNGYCFLSLWCLVVFNVITVSWIKMCLYKFNGGFPSFKLFYLYLNALLCAWCVETNSPWSITSNAILWC